MHRPSHWRAAASSVSSVTSAAARRPSGRRFASSFATRATGRTASVLTRWGLAGAAVYYYNTSNVFAEEHRQAFPEANTEFESFSSIDTLAEQRRAQAKQSSHTMSAVLTDEDQATPVESPEGLEEEAAQQGAFNEETGEINWDCPCLGGMAHGPCGEQFKAAFSCFVFSKEEPKGVECIEHFKTMQNCFRDHPDIYGAELTDDGEDGEYGDESADLGPSHAVEVARDTINETVENTADAISADASKVVSRAQKSAEDVGAASTTSQQAPPQGKAKSDRSRKALLGDEGGDLLPKAAHDTRDENEKVKPKK